MLNKLKEYRELKEWYQEKENIDITKDLGVTIYDFVKNSKKDQFEPEEEKRKPCQNHKKFSKDCDLCLKKCSKCLSLKELKEFNNLSKNKKDGKQNYCKTCRREVDKNRTKKSKRGRGLKGKIKNKNRWSNMELFRLSKGWKKSKSKNQAPFKIFKDDQFEIRENKKTTINLYLGPKIGWIKAVEIEKTNCPIGREVHLYRESNDEISIK